MWNKRTYQSTTPCISRCFRIYYCGLNMKASLKNRIETFLRNHPDTWILSAEIERLTFENTKYIASNSTRRLRELHEANPNRIQRKHEKGLAYYRYIPSEAEIYHNQMQLN